MWFLPPNFAFLDENFPTKKIFRQFSASPLQLCRVCITCNGDAENCRKILQSAIPPNLEIINVLKRNPDDGFCSIFGYCPSNTVYCFQKR